MKVVAVSKNIV